MIQWRYITANSCFPPGYRNTEVGDTLQDLGWLRASGMSDCIFPYDPTGATGSGMPEQFWNCAEISIECNDPTISPAPTRPPVPTPEVTSPPVPAPTDPPGPTPGYCSYSGIWDTSSKYYYSFRRTQVYLLKRQLYLGYSIISLTIMNELSFH